MTRASANATLPPELAPVIARIGLGRLVLVHFEGVNKLHPIANPSRGGPNLANRLAADLVAADAGKHVWTADFGDFRSYLYSAADLALAVRLLSLGVVRIGLYQHARIFSISAAGRAPVYHPVPARSKAALRRFFSSDQTKPQNPSARSRVWAFLLRRVERIKQIRIGIRRLSPALGDEPKCRCELCRPELAESPGHPQQMGRPPEQNRARDPVATAAHLLPSAPDLVRA